MSSLDDERMIDLTVLHLSRLHPGSAFRVLLDDGTIEVRVH
jgi:hypothetical protein